jgi:hypothetical protein
MGDLSKKMFKVTIFCVLLLFITLFFPLYFSPSSPTVWLKTNLYIKNVVLRPPSLCELGLHYSICDELDIYFQYSVSDNLHNCSINVSDNVRNVYNFYTIKNLTHIEGYYSRITHNCREFYYEPFFVFGFFILNFVILIFCITYIYRSYKYYTKHLYRRDIEILLAEPRAII